jgi:hypothetical protein
VGITHTHSITHTLPPHPILVYVLYHNKSTSLCYAFPPICDICYGGEDYQLGGADRRVGENLGIGKVGYLGELITPSGVGGVNYLGG